MGFLDSGDTLEWDEVVFVIDYIKRHGVKQLLHTYQTNKTRNLDRLKWGDEVRVGRAERRRSRKKTELLFRWST